VAKDAGGGLVPISTSLDVYSFSVTIWELAARRMAVDNLGMRKPYDWKEVARRGGEGERPPMYDVGKLCGNEVVELIRQCWDTDHQKRPSCSEIKVQDPASLCVSRHC
jgi:hypothetical protein